MNDLPLPRALLFDMDDTILVYDAGAEACWRQAIAQHVERFEGRTPERVRAAIRDYSDWYWSDPERHRVGRQALPWARRLIVSQAMNRLGIADPGAADAVACSYNRLREELIVAVPGALETLQVLRAAGMPMALLTNGHPNGQQPKIDRFGLAPFFDCIVIEGAYGVGKPDPAVFHYALQQLGVEPRHAWMVGDNLVWDVAGAQRVGIMGIWVDWRGHGLPPESRIRPDAVVRSIAELPALMGEALQ